MKIYICIFLFFTPFLGIAQHINQSPENGQNQNAVKYQSEIFTRGRLVRSVNSSVQRRTPNRGHSGADHEIHLDTLKIQAKKNFKVKNYGYYNEGFFYRLFHFATYNFSKNGKNYRHERGVYIRHPQTNHPIFIKRILLRAWSKNDSALATIRVHLYPIDLKNKIIGFDLLKKEHMVQLTTKRSLKIINIAAEHLPFPPTGILVTVEKVGKTGQPVLQMTKAENGNSVSYNFKSKKQNSIKNTLNATPLGGINKNLSNRYGLEQMNYMIGVSTVVGN